MQWLVLPSLPAAYACARAARRGLPPRPERGHVVHVASPLSTINTEDSHMDRRRFVQFAAALPLTAAVPMSGFVRDAWAQQRTYTPRPGQWRTYEVTTQV